MPITVRGPDGATLNFPDGTSQEEMRRAMISRYGPPGEGQRADDYRIPFRPTPQQVEQQQQDAQAQANSQRMTQGIGAAYGQFNRIRNALPGPIGLIADTIAGVEAVRSRSQSGEAARDFQQDDGIVDRSASLIERSVGSAIGGLERVAGTVLPGGIGRTMQSRARTMEDTGNREVAGETTWDAVKEDPFTNILPFIYETALGSALEMGITAVPVVGLGVEATIQSGRIGQQRAENDGRRDATLGDVGVGALFGIPTAFLERLGIKGIGNGASTAGRRIAGAAATEGATEFAQSSLEYTGGTLGTEAGYDPVEMLDQGFAGAVGGAGMGAGIRTTIEGADAISNRVRRPRAPISAQDQASPLPDDLIAEGRAATGLEADGPAMPQAGGRVTVTAPTGEQRAGVFQGITRGEDGAAVVTIQMDDGRTISQPADILADAGFQIRPEQGGAGFDYTAAADAIDGQLAAGAEQSTAQAQAAAAQPSPSILTPPALPAPPSQAAPVTGNGREQFKARVRRSESGGNDRARNPNGSASGRYQFIESTFKTLYQRVYGGSPADAAAAWNSDRRYAPEVQERLMDAAINEYEQVYSRAGITPTAGNLYLAHFFGPQMAARVLQAPRGADIGSIVGEQAVAANERVLRGKTVADVIAWTDRAMGGAGAVDAGGGAALPGYDAPAGTQFADMPDLAAPARLAREPINFITEDRTDTAITTTGREVPVRYAVAELSDLVASNDVEGNPNPAFPADRQPRDRTRAASRAQIQEIAAKLNPRLLGRSPKASDGAPIVSIDGIVESGNGRTIALQVAYAAGGERVDAYRQMIEAEGFDTSGMQQPVLVRVRDPNMSEGDVRAAIREANQRETAAMSVTENAQVDAQAITPDMLLMFRGGDLDAASNRRFVQSFVRANIPMAEQNAMSGKAGEINAQLQQRIEAAMLVRAYGWHPFISTLVEATSSNIRTIGGALTEAAAGFAKLKDAIAEGRVDPAMDISPNIAEAVQIINQARQDEKPVALYVKHSDAFRGDKLDPMTEAVLRLFFSGENFTRPLGRKRLSETFAFYINEAMNGGSLDGMFGSSTLAPIADILGTVNDKRDTSQPEDEAPIDDVGETAGGDGGDVRAPGADVPGQGGADVQAQDGGDPPADEPQLGLAEAAAPAAPADNLRARPELGPTFADPEGSINRAAVLNAIREGRGNSVTDGGKRWAIREGYATVGPKGRIAGLSSTGQTELASIEEANGTAAARREREAAGVERASSARVEETITGKSVAIIGASEAELAAVASVIPNAKPLVRKDGATVYSKKYEDKIRAALADFGKGDGQKDDLQDDPEMAAYERKAEATQKAAASTGLPDGYSLKKETSGIFLARPDGSMVGGYIAPSSYSLSDLSPNVLKIARNRAKEDMAKTPAPQPTAPPIRQVMVNTVGADGLTEAERNAMAAKRGWPPFGPMVRDVVGDDIDKDWTAFSTGSKTLGIPRADMPQIKSAHRGALINFLNARGIEHSEAEVQPSSLLPTQAEFSPAKVKQAIDYDYGDRAILISSDGYLVDGHHQWLAALWQQTGRGDREHDVRVIQLQAPIRDVLAAIAEFPSVQQSKGATGGGSVDLVYVSKAGTQVKNLVPGRTPDAERRVIGTNTYGQEISEDARGARSIVRDGIRLTEPVPISMSRERGVEAQPSMRRRDDPTYMTTDEWRDEIGRQTDVLLPKAERSQKTLDQLGADIPGWQSPGVKGRDRIIEKVLTEGYASPLWLKDVVRGAAVVDTMADADRIAEQVISRFTVVQDKGWQTLSSGYVDRKIIVEIDGVKAEVQIVPRVVWDAKKDGANALYKQYRVAGTEAAKDRLQSEMQAVYAAALADSDFASLSSAAKSTSSNAAPASRGERGTPSLSASAGAETQSASERPSPSQTNAEGGTRENTATSRPSTSNSDGAGIASTSEPQVGANGEESNKGPSPNRLVTDERAAELRERLKAKLSPNRLNAGIDPEIIAIGSELAVYHIEKGARRFTAFARAIAADLGMGVRDLRQYLRGWYNGSRDMLEDMGESVAGMDTPDEVAKAMRTLDQWADEAPADQVTPPADSATGATNGLQGSLSDGDAGAGARDVPVSAQDRGAGSAPQPQDAGSVQPAGTTDGQRTEAPERGGARPAGAGSGRADGAAAADRVPGGTEPSVAPTNWRIEPDSLLEARKPMEKAEDNVRAIEIVKRLQEEGRAATPEEQAQIALYVGWGGLANVFPRPDGTYANAGMQRVGLRLKELLTKEEYDTARRSTQYAHYTSEKVVRPMWELARRLGFKGGTVFEPGMGTGNFAGMMPADLAAATSYQGLEYDRLTAQIAKALYPAWGVRQDDYTKTPRIVDQFDLAIGNPPFSRTVISGDPYYGKMGFLLHDFFFAKTLDALRPGGLLLFVTSAGTMNKVEAKAREYLADRADLVGAVRLPSTAFAENAGTEVTTDIIVLRKRPVGAAAGDRSWTETVQMPMPDREGNMTMGTVNRYFADNPAMILGEQGMFDKLVAGPRYGVRAKPGMDLEQALLEALDNMSMRHTLTEHLNTAAPAPATTDAPAPAAVDFMVTEQKEGSFYVKDGDLYRLEGGVGRKVQSPGKGVTGGVSKDAQAKIRRLVGIRDALRATLAGDLSGDAAASEKARADLNRKYDDFVAAFGPINKTDIRYQRPSIIQQESARAKAREEARANGLPWDEGSFDATPLYDSAASTGEIARARQQAREAAKAAGRPFDEGSFNPEDMDDVPIIKRPNIDPFMSDQEGYRLRSIEHFNEDTGVAKKGLVFFENPVAREAKPAIASPEDALLYVMAMRGRPDIAEIARLAGASEADTLAALKGYLFKVPGTDRYETRENYLSGNVRDKLDVARRALEGDESLAHNVAALEAVQPEPLSRVEITVQLGMPWVPTDVIEKFGTEALGLSSLNVSYNRKLARYSVSGDDRSVAATTDWGTQKREAPYLVADALNRTSPKIYRKLADGRSELDDAATQEAQDKIFAIKARFREWVWEDEQRALEIENLYNREYNNLVAPVFDGSYLKTPGINAKWRWRPHQSAVVARIIQTGNTYMAHGVGAGKTSAMIGAGMEMKRLGLVKKPAYAVPNHMLGQFTKEFYEQYPTARIMVADETRFHTSRRKQFVADVANSDIDAVILTHSSFGLLPVSAEFENSLLDEQIADLRSALEEIANDQSSRVTIKQLEQQIEQLEQRQEALRNRKKDAVYTFEETGIDFLFVDEAHMFRKLGFATKMGQVKGIDPNGAQSSFDLFAKIQMLETRNPGRSVVLASGTPITNTMAELYTVQRYMQRGMLRAKGLDRFDAWAGSFGDTDTKLEQDPAGGYKPVTRFAKFVNVPELSVMVRQFMDVVTSQELEALVVRPKLKDGKRNMVVVEQTDRQRAYQDFLRERMVAIQARKGPPAPGDDILLSVINDGRKAAIDMRLIDRDNPKEDSKLERLVANVYRIWQESKRQPFHAIEADGYSAKPVDFGPATQMVFADLGVNETEGKDGSRGISVHEYIRAQLIQRGVPQREIALISAFKNAVQRQRLFNDMNDGRVRILIGSVPKMGTGVNAQQRLLANHNLDAQWYPANDEQRNGRIIRQGNMNPEVEIYDYSTKGTYDSTMWGLMENKARFIEGFMRGDPTMRDMEDLGEASQYEQAKAMTTSDPRMIVLTELRQSLEKAQLRKQAFDRAQAGLRRKLAQANENKRDYTKRIAEIEADLAQRVDVKGDAFEAQADGITFTERAKFGEALLVRMDQMAAEKKITGKTTVIGKMGGFELAAQAFAFAGNVDVELYLVRNGTLDTIPQSNSALGLVQSIASRLGRFDDNLAFAKNELARAEQDLVDFAGRGNETFAGQAEIDDLYRQVTDLETELAAESNKDAAKESRPDDLFAEPAQPERSMTPRQRAELEARQKQGMSRRGGQQGLGDQEGGLFGSERAQGSLFRRGGTDTGTVDADALRARLNELGLSDKVTLDIVASLDGAAGDFRGGGAAIIRVAMDTRQDGMFTLEHEAIHALRNAGLFTATEWNLLSAAAKRDEKTMASIRRRYPDLDAEAQLEEAVADRFAAWAKGDRQASALARLFQRIADVLTAIRNALTGAGFDSAGAVMRRVGSGAVGGRIPGISRAAFTADRRRDVVDNPNFGRWFGDSKVVDAAGNPIVVYHGTNKSQNGDAFTMFDTYASNYGLMGMGGYFTENADVASSYTAKGKGETPSVYPVFLKIDKPLDMDAPADVAAWEDAFDGIADYHEGGESNESWYRAAERLTMDEGYSRWEGAEVMQQGIIAMGHDGVTHIGGGRVKTDGIRHRVWIVFDPEQVKSAIGNNGGFDPTNPDIRQSRVTQELDLTEYVADSPTGRMGQMLDRMRVKLQDRYLPLLRVQQRVESAIGGPLPQVANPYIREELMTGRIGAKLDRLSNDMIDPLFVAMHKAGVTVDELETYLYARHAPERNAQIAKINPEMPDGGSGMSDIEAAALINRMERAGKLDAIKAIADMVDSIRDFALKQRIDTGLLSEDEAQAWRDTYENYVPLRGREEVEGDATGLTERVRRAGGINVRGKESRRAFGRRSKADNILAYTLLQAEEAIVRGETNRVAQAFVNMVRLAPDPEFWQVEKVTRKAVLDSSTGMVRYENQTRIQAEDKDWTVAAKFGGEEVRVTMERTNPSARRLATAMKRLTEHQLDWVVQYLGIPTRFLSAVNTSWNPEFIITNAFRDLQSALVNLTGEQRTGLVGGVARDYRKALVASTKGAFGKGEGEWARWYKEMTDEGGRVFFNRIDDLDALKKRVQEGMIRAEGKLTVKRGLIAVRDFVEAANNGVENAVRLATYKNAREIGLSKQEAASLAKNVTVNFNRRGELGAGLNAFYMFFNASMQGSVRILTAMKSKRVRKILAGVAVGSFMLELLNAMLSDDDEDGESYYDKISAFDKNRNIVIMLPGEGGRHIKIPMPYGYNVFASLGRTSAEIIRRGGDGAMTSAGDFTTAVVDAFNPVGGTESLLNFISPTLVDPIVDLMRNRDYADRPIMPEENAYGPQDPDAQRYFGSVGPQWRAITDALTSLTGGDDVVAGAIDVSPETLEYLAGTVFGAAGAFLDRQISLGSKILDGDPSTQVEASDLPMARKVFSSKPSWYDRSAYYDRMGQVEQAVSDAGDYLERQDVERFESYVDANRQLLTLEPAMKEARRTMRQLRAARGEAELANRIGRLDDAGYQQIRNQVRDQEEVIIRQFNTLWNATMHPRDDAQP